MISLNAYSSSKVGEKQSHQLIGNSQTILGTSYIVLRHAYFFRYASNFINISNLDTSMSNGRIGYDETQDVLKITNTNGAATLRMTTFGKTTLSITLKTQH
jgi:hypothetical protein